MESWNVEQIGERDFALLNRTGTLITVGKRRAVNLPLILSSLEENDVPLAYSEGVQEVKFTLLPGTNAGWYKSNRIRLHVGSTYGSSRLASILCHEFAHHVDSHEGISEQPEITQERKKYGSEMYMTYALKDNFEYIACAFEVYYFGTAEEKKRLKKFNRYVYGFIDIVHKKYRTK